MLFATSTIFSSGTLRVNAPINREDSSQSVCSCSKFKTSPQKFENGFIHGVYDQLRLKQMCSPVLFFSVLTIPIY